MHGKQTQLYRRMGLLKYLFYQPKIVFVKIDLSLLRLSFYDEIAWALNVERF